MRKRRRPAVAWLPHVAIDSQDPKLGVWNGSVTVAAANNGFNTTILSLTPDFPAEAIRASGDIASLSDFEGSAYRLRRVVGKVFLGMNQQIGAAMQEYPMAALVGVGFMVTRVDPQNGAPLVGAAADPNFYSPIINDATRDPWVWRRTWVLVNDFANSTASTQAIWQFPRTNCEYPSVADGPHIDQKTARRVSDEERLFAIISTQNISGTADIAGSVKYVLDYRILASMYRTSGNRRNASR